MAAASSVCAWWSQAGAAGRRIVDVAVLRNLDNGGWSRMMSGWPRGSGCNYGQRRFGDQGLIVRSDHVAPIYVINLLITDLIQLCCMIVQVVPLKDLKIADIFIDIYLSALMASVGFMVCVALERYLVIACPMWYRFKRTIKFSVVVCIVVWTLPLFFFFIFLFEVNPKVPQTVSGIFLLLPFPLLIFFLVGTLKTLSASISVPSDEKRRIVGILVLVLLNYTLLFMPSIIGYLSNEARNNITFRHLYVIFVRLNPLADLVLYVFMRKGIIDKLLASVCCCRMDSNEISSPSV
ncbi:G-protein coupled receptor 4-like [Micropterus salmoides]|uniref:G-protein coupled receptor 4-like n=1 Tax=Micropterus salmoides TaxID=27706 RepID=UPI0018ECBD8B|nr:G-protein coupled receptor 4-like [Micropterus salmoides]